MADLQAIDYTSKDFDGFRSSLLDYASRVFPEWTSRSEGDFGVLMVELFSYMGDVLSYYGDRISQEAFLGTATQRSSLLQIASLLGYTPSNGGPATGTVTLVTSNPGSAKVVPAGTQFATDFIEALDGPLIYETDEEVTVPADGGTVTVGLTHGVTQTQVRIGTSNGLAEQVFRLPHTPVLDGTVKLYVETVSGLQEWTWIQHLIDANASDQVFTTRNDDAGGTYVVLGDSVSGRIPSTGLGVYATYRVGGGSAGNISAGNIKTMVSATPVGVSVHTVSGVYQSSEMTGGADPESNATIRRNAPLAFRTQQRAVTLQDFEDTALSAPGVSRTRAVANHATSVTVYITGPQGGVPSTGLVNDVHDLLASRALAGVSVTVAAPTLPKVNFGAVSNEVKVEVLPRHSRKSVTEDTTKALQHLLSVDRTSFGMRLTLADVLSEIKTTVPGIAFVQVPMFARADAPQTGVADIQFRPWEIPVVGNIVLSVTGGVG